MDLWIVRKKKDGAFEAEERVALSESAEFFERGLAENGRSLKLRIPKSGQEVDLRGWVVPAYAKLRRSADGRAFEERVIQRLTELTKALTERRSHLPSIEARDALVTLDALIRARRPYCAIVVS